MASINKVILIGNLGQDPETRYMPDGGAITSLSIATNETWKDKNGDKKEKVEWHRVVIFGKLAEIAGEYLKKGSQCYIEGRLQTRKWEKDGVERYTTEIVANAMQMLGSRGGGDNGFSSQQQRSSSSGTPRREMSDEEIDQNIAAGKAKAAAKSGGKFDDFPDDIPF